LFFLVTTMSFCPSSFGGAILMVLLRSTSSEEFAFLYAVLSPFSKVLTPPRLCGLRLRAFQNESPDSTPNAGTFCCFTFAQAPSCFCQLFFRTCFSHTSHPCPGPLPSMCQFFNPSSSSACYSKIPFFPFKPGYFSASAIPDLPHSPGAQVVHLFPSCYGFSFLILPVPFSA